jgi:chromate reductase
MTNSPKILVFAGSARSGSYNKLLAHIAENSAREAGADVTFVDFRDLTLPLFDQDLEAASGMPEGAKKFKALLRESDGFIISSPEYNSSIAPALKNAIDWASRPESDDEPALVAFHGKVAALLSASPGGLGGMRGLVHLRSILGNIGVLVLPDQVSISAAYEAFEESGKLKDERKAKQVADVARTLVEVAGKLRK